MFWNSFIEISIFLFFSTIQRQFLFYQFSSKCYHTNAEILNLMRFHPIDAFYFSQDRLAKIDQAFAHFSRSKRALIFWYQILESSLPLKISISNFEEIILQLKPKKKKKKVELDLIKIVSFFKQINSTTSQYNWSTHEI